MSESDNTATDMLMDVLGWEPVAKVLGMEVALTTREFFILKASPREANLWRNGRASDWISQKKRLVDLPLPDVSSVLRPYEITVGWQLSTKTLCAVMNSLGRSNLAAINTGIADKSDWEFVTYKGGSDIGVYNYTTRVEWEGKTGCISLTWNGDANTDTSKLIQYYREALTGLKNS